MSLFNQPWYKWVGWGMVAAQGACALVMFGAAVFVANQPASYVPFWPDLLAALFLIELGLAGVSILWFSWVVPWCESGDPRSMQRPQPLRARRVHQALMWFPAGAVVVVGGIIGVLSALNSSRASQQGTSLPLDITPDVLMGGLSGGVLLIGLGVFTMALRRRADHRYDALFAAHSRCPRCGYDLRGNPAASQCPECGGTAHRRAGRHSVKRTG